jgi:hypothetical protein
MTDAQEMLLIGLLMSALPFPGGERWFGWHRQTQSGSCWRSGAIMLSGDVEFSPGFSVELIWRVPSERGCQKLSWGQRESQTHLALKTTANRRSSRGNGLDERLLTPAEYDSSHRNIFIRGNMTMLLFQAKLCRIWMQVKGRVKSPGYVAFE